MTNAMRRFHRSLYISLGIACACLAYAEWPYLPEIAALSCLVGIALVVAYRAEGRWSLSLRAANIVGGLIGIVVVGWMVFQIVHPTGTLLKLLPWPASLLPYLGPLVLTIIPAKLFRPKHSGDYWGLQFMALMGVGLACALGGDVTLTVLVLAYVVAAVKTLADFHALGNSQSKTLDLQPSLGWRRAAILTAIVGPIAVVVSWLIPRVSDARWEFGNLITTLKTGISDERPAIDLNISGQLQISSEEAFSVYVENANGQPKLDLPSNQRWRATTFNYYDRGKWQNRNWATYSDQRRMRRMVVPESGPIAPFVRPKNRGETTPLPNLGPNQYFVTFNYPTRMHQAFHLAEPIWAPLRDTTSTGQMYRAPLETVSNRGRRQPWVSQPEGDVYPPIVSSFNAPTSYRQVIAPLPEANVSLPIEADSAFEKHLTTINRLPRLKEYANELLRKLVATNEIPWEGAALKDGEKPTPELHEAMARAFARYLGTSGEFQYSFTLERNDSDIDPIEDFLLNSKTGHCNRFSSALALLLRCHGVPTRIVMGHCGAESQNDGRYIIRQSAAHSWVETIIRRRASDGRFTQHWLTLDPTPEEYQTAASESWAHWFDRVATAATAFTRNYIVDFQPERAQELGQTLLSFDWRKSLVIIIVAGISMVICWKKPWRRRPSDRKSPELPYERLVELVQRSGLVKFNPAWTPQEFVGQIASSTANREVVRIAQRIVECHYRQRFGGEAAIQQNDDDLRLVRQSLAA